MTFKDWVQDNFIKELEIIMMPITKKILIWGFILCGIVTTTCIYINSNKMHQSDFVFWLPIWAFLYWLFFLIIVFICERHIKNKFNTYIFVCIKLYELVKLFSDKVKNNHPEEIEVIKAIDKFEKYAYSIYVWTSSLREHYKEYIIEDFPPKKLIDHPESPYSKKELAEFERQSKLELKKYKKEQLELSKKKRDIISNG